MKLKKISVFFGIIALLCSIGLAKASWMKLLATELLESQAPRRALSTIARTQGFKPSNLHFELNPEEVVNIVLPQEVEFLDSTGEVYRPLGSLNQSTGSSFKVETSEEPEIQRVDDSLFVDLEKK
tara:strand:+ start:231 stop:605 length:375 start_codon:yes stop_codon:yes gene_type:complete